MLYYLSFQYHHSDLQHFQGCLCSCKTIQTRYVGFYLFIFCMSFRPNSFVIFSRQQSYAILSSVGSNYMHCDLEDSIHMQCFLQQKAILCNAIVSRYRQPPYALQSWRYAMLSSVDCNHMQCNLQHLPADNNHTQCYLQQQAITCNAILSRKQSYAMLSSADSSHAMLSSVDSNHIQCYLQQIAIICNAIFSR